MAIVIAVSGLMCSYLFEMNQFSNSRECYLTTRIQLIATRDAIERFARKNDRLPLPAQRNIGSDNIAYGREASAMQIAAGGIDQVGGASWGALPFQALGLPSEYAGDCWGNKITYVVTTALTTNAAFSGFRDNSVIGNLAVKSAPASTQTPTGAYALISHGQDQLGAVQVNYSGASHGWCTGIAIKNYNCNISGATVASAMLNSEAGLNYFDDIVMAADKPGIFIPLSNAYCWGSNTLGKLGDATTTTRAALTAVHGTQAYMALTSGHDFNCGLTALGEAWCWGDNVSGQLGDGGTSTRLEPVKVTGSGADPLSFIALAAGYNHACGLNVTGDAYCWGDNTYGQLGDGASGTTRTAPFKVTGGITFTRIMAGKYRTCGLTASNALYCWGDNTTGGMAATVGIKTAPTLISSGPFLLVSMDADSSTQCGVSTAGHGYCWGAGSNGELGNGTTTANSNSIVAVSGGLTFRTISVGGTHVCGLTGAGAAYCWGTGSNGIAGNGTAAAAQTTPIAVTGGHVFSEIAAGNDHTCAHEAGSIYCWGMNTDSNLGDGTTTNSYTPVKVTSTGAGSYVMGTLSAGNYHSCAIAPVDRSYCWNDNANGQVGDGTTTPRAVPTLVGGNKKFTSIVRTTGFSCGLTAAGAAWCWGDGTAGALGNGAYASSSAPVAVNGGITFTKLSSGDALICGLASNGGTYCWGWNAYGQLGINSTTQTNAPAIRAGANNYRDVAAGYDHSCAIRDNGAGYCWGWNLIKQLAVLSLNIYEDTPMAITGGLTFTSITAGASFTCGIRDNGVIYCWGTNLLGAMGNGLPGIDNIIPLPTTSALKFRQISAGTNHVCGLDQTGYPYCWGDNSNGQLGLGNLYPLSFNPTAVLVDGVTAIPFARIQAGGNQTCAYTANGKAYCWGNLAGTIVYYPTLVNSTAVFGSGSQGVSCATAP